MTASVSCVVNDFVNAGRCRVIPAPALPPVGCGRHDLRVTATEGDETVEDNSPGRLLALSDGVFAIAMTLLALDLRLPDLPDNAGPAVVTAAVAAVFPHALTFLLSFYVVAAYWRAHHRIMRSVTGRTGG